jgi:hypothetical protein
MSRSDLQHLTGEPSSRLPKRIGCAGVNHETTEGA